MSRFRRTYGQARQAITDVIGGISYDYYVDTYADLPLAPPEGMAVFVVNAGGDVTYGWYVYGIGVWTLITGFTTSIDTLPITPILYGSNVVVAALSKVSTLDDREFVCSADGPPTLWNEQSPPVSVAEYTDLPLTPPLNYKILCTNASLAGLGPLQSVVLQHDTDNNWFVIKAAINDVTDIPGSTTIFSDIVYDVIATGGTILYSPDRAWIYTGIEWQEYSPDVQVVNFTTLPILPPDGIIALVSVDQGSMLTPITLQYDAIANEWEILAAYWDLPSTLPDLSTPFYDDLTTVVVGVSNVTRLISLNRIFEWTGVAWSELLQSDSRNWGPAVDETTINTLIGAGFQVDGDTFIDQSIAGTVTKIWNAAQWNHYQIEWDGASSGELSSDLPLVNNYTGAIAVVGTRIFEWNGSEWMSSTSQIQEILTNNPGSLTSTVTEFTADPGLIQIIPQ